MRLRASKSATRIESSKCGSTLSKQKSRYRWILTALRLGLCVVAVVYLYRNVNWNDYATLTDGARVRIVEYRGDDLVIERDGANQTISLSDVALIEGSDPPLPDINYGIASVVADIDRGKTFLAVLLFFPATMLQPLRLVWMLAIQNVRLSFWNAVKLSFAGNFFNFALPGTTGGDLIKAYYLTRFTHHKTEAVTTVFLDRVVGLLGLVILAGTMILVSPDSGQLGNVAPVLAVILACLAVGVVIVFSRRIRNALHLADLAARLPAGDHLLRIGRTAIAMRGHKSLVLMCLGVTIVLQLIVMISAYEMAQAIGMGGDLSYYLIFVPIGFLIAAVPINPPQGFGVMESAYLMFFSSENFYYATNQQAFAFALAVRLIALIWALPGVLVPLLGAHLPSKAELAEMEAAEQVDLSREPETA